MNVKPVLIPEIIWGKLATVADDRGVSVEDILVAAVRQIIDPATVEERIVDLVRAGWPDRVIAGKTGELVARVATVRRAANLPPNKFRPWMGAEAKGPDVPGPSSLKEIA
jgi:hypothetical protein